jgi:hypothetical protein
MDKLIEALSDMQHGSEIAMEEIEKLENFSPEEGRSKLLDVLNLIGSLSDDIRSFFDELIEDGKAPLTFTFFEGTDPLTIFGENE